MTPHINRGLSRLLAVGAIVFLLIPPIALAVTVDVTDLSEAVRDGLWPALWLSLKTTFVSAVVIVLFGTALAWWIGRRNDRLGRVVEAVVRLPAITPPAVAGVALLLAFGRGGLLGPALEAASIQVTFTSLAVVLAQVFVAMPFYVLPLAEAFREVDEDMLLTARSLGASPARAFFRIAIPLVRPALLSGLAMAWARALGEFGATLMFAGNLPGQTQTLPIAIYASMEDGLGAARAMSILLIGIASVLLGALGWLGRKR